MVFVEGVEWDPEKEQINRDKHGVAFAEAAQVFAGVTVSARDERISYGEERWLTIGESSVGDVLVVAHTQRGTRRRIISARLANRKEQQRFYAKIKKSL